MFPYPLEGTTQGGTSENRLVPGESHLFLCSFPHCPQPLLSIQKGILSQLLINSCGNDRGLFRLASLSGHREPRQKSKVFFVLYWWGLPLRFLFDFLNFSLPNFPPFFNILVMLWIRCIWLHILKHYVNVYMNNTHTLSFSHTYTYTHSLSNTGVHTHTHTHSHTHIHTHRPRNTQT